MVNNRGHGNKKITLKVITKTINNKWSMIKQNCLQNIYIGLSRPCYEHLQYIVNIDLKQLKKHINMIEAKLQ